MGQHSQQIGLHGGIQLEPDMPEILQKEQGGNERIWWMLSGNPKTLRRLETLVERSNSIANPFVKDFLFSMETMKDRGIISSSRARSKKPNFVPCYFQEQTNPEGQFLS